MRVVLPTPLVETPSKSRLLAGSGHLVDLLGFPGGWAAVPPPWGAREAGVRGLAHPPPPPLQCERCPQSDSAPSHVSPCRWWREGQSLRQTQQPKSQVPGPRPGVWGPATLRLLSAFGGRLQPPDPTHQPRVGGPALVRRWAPGAGRWAWPAARAPTVCGARGQACSETLAQGPGQPNWGWQLVRMLLVRAQVEGKSTI